MCTQYPGIGAWVHIVYAEKFGMMIFAGVYQDLAPTAFSGKK